MKTKRDLLFHALRMQRKHPFISAFPCELPGFPADQDLLYCITQILPQIDCLKTRLDNDQAMADRQSQKNGETRIRPFPVFNRAADPDIFIALAPVGRQTLPKALNPLGEKYKCAVGAPPHHFPACSAPGIRIRQQKIRGEAGEHLRAGRYFFAAVPLFAQRQVETCVFTAKAACLRRPVHCIPAVYITIFAARADFCAPVPWFQSTMPFVSCSMAVLSFSDASQNNAQKEKCIRYHKLAVPFQLFRHRANALRSKAVPRSFSEQAPVSRFRFFRNGVF